MQSKLIMFSIIMVCFVSCKDYDPNESKLNEEPMTALNQTEKQDGGNTECPIPSIYNPSSGRCEVDIDNCDWWKDKIYGDKQPEEICKMKACMVWLGVPSTSLQESEFENCLYKIPVNKSTPSNKFVRDMYIRCMRGCGIQI